jgi:hypothetical protein
MPVSQVLTLVRRKDLIWSRTGNAGYVGPVGRALMFSRPGASSRHALVNGAAGVLTWQGDRLIAVLGFTIAHDKIVAIDVLADPERLSRIGDEIRTGSGT